METSNKSLNPFKGKTGPELFLEVVGFFALTLVFFALCIDAAHATGNNHNDDNPVTVEVEADANANADANAMSDATATAEGGAAAAEASNEGNSLSVESNYESGPADLILVPNNNTEPCLRVFGLAFGNKEGSGMFGVPWRSKQCDYKGYAADADAQGNLELGWFWRCHMKSAYNVFRDKDESVDTAINQCVTQMVGKVELAREVDKLNDLLEFERNERRIERENATTNAEQLKKSCSDSTSRILEACRK